MFYASHGYHRPESNLKSLVYKENQSNVITTSEIYCYIVLSVLFHEYLERIKVFLVSYINILNCH